MGRGLSELQKAMLRLAWAAKEKHDNARKDEELVERWKKWDHENFKRYLLPDDAKPIPPAEFQPFIEDNWLGAVFFTDVYKAVYGWTPKPRSPLCKAIRPDKFSKKEIGTERYMAAYIAVRKATQRLKVRGLIASIGDSYYLTPQGEDLMAKLGQTSAKAEDKELLAKLSDPAPIIEVKDTIAPIDKPIKRTRYKKRREILEYVLAELQAGREPRISDVAAKFETPTARYEIWLPPAVNHHGGIIHNTKKGIKAIEYAIG